MSSSEAVPLISPDQLSSQAVSSRRLLTQLLSITAVSLILSDQLFLLPDSFTSKVILLSLVCGLFLLIGDGFVRANHLPDRNAVLIVDDEKQVREALRDILDLKEIPSLAAASGQEGVSLFEAHQDTIGLIILDLTMPGMSGIETFNTLRELDPAAKIILSSGFTEAEVLQKMAGTRPTGFLQKPYRLETVLTTVEKHLL